MKKRWIVGLVVMVITDGAFRVARAADQPAATPISPASSVSPKSVSLEGSLTALNLQSVTPTLTVTVADGKPVTFALDLKTIVG